MARWLTIVGIGEDGLAGLGARARALVDDAEVLVGGARHLAMVPDDGRERLPWPSPLAALIDGLLAMRPRRVCVLATGDPLHYGVGVTLVKRVPADEIDIVPAPSAFALACARLAWPRAECATLTLHGRPVAEVQPFIQPGARLLILCDDGTTPARVAALLVARGYGASPLVALAHMGGVGEERVAASAHDWAGRRVADFVTLAVECVADPGTAPLARVPGLPDDAFRHDGMLTKREVRAATLAALAPVPGELLWDVGAGSGAVAIEWMRTDPLCRAVAIERAPARVALIRANAEALGTPRLAIVEGEAPAALSGLDAPDAIFVGGGVAAPGLLAHCWQALRPGGRLVANAVTLEGERALLDHRAEHGGDLARIAVSHAEAIGGRTGWSPLRTVTQLRAHKR